MRRLARVVSVAAIFLIAAPAVWAQTGLLRFEATGPSRANLDLVVYEAGGDSIRYVLTTDAQGIAQRGDVPFGTYYAYPDPDLGLLTTYPFAPAIVSTPDELTPGELNVYPPDPEQGLLRGTLTDSATGEPIRGALGYYTGAEPSGPDVGTTYTLTTVVDGEGNYFFQGTAGRTWNLFLDVYPFEGNAIYRQANFQFVSVAGETEFLDLTLTRVGTAVLSGTVRDEDGAPVPFTDVRLIDVATNQDPVYTVTNTDGTYAVDVFEGTYLAAAALDDPAYARQYFDGAFFESDATPITVTDQDISEIDFALTQIASDFNVRIEGRLRDPDGAPIPNGFAELFLADDFSDSIATSDTDGEGAFLFLSPDSTLIGEEVVLRFSAEGFVTEFYDDRPTFELATPLALTAAENEFDLGGIVLAEEGGDIAGHAVTGRMVAAETSQGIGGALVTALRTDAPGVHYAVTDADGTYRLDGLSDGDYVVLATHDGRSPVFYPDADTWVEAEAMAVQGDLADVDAALPAMGDAPPFAEADVIVSVQDADGQPFEAALVTARDADGLLRDFALTDADGTAELVNLRGRAVTLQTDAPRFAVDQRTVVVPPAPSAPVQTAVELAPFAPVANEGGAAARALTLSIAPNPASDRVQFLLDLPAREAAQVTVYDVLGRSVAVFTEDDLQSDRLRLDASRLTAGMYFVRVEAGEQRVVKRFTVVR